MRLAYLIIGGAALIILAYVLMLLAVSYFSSHSSVIKFVSGPKQYQNVKIGSGIFNLEFATTTLAQLKGLSGRASMPQDQGMIFIFNQPGRYGFWMINMKFSLDMIWLNNQQVIYILSNVPPNSFPKIFYPPSVADVVVELNAGALNSVGLKVGDKLDY